MILVNVKESFGLDISQQTSTKLLCIYSSPFILTSTTLLYLAYFHEHNIVISSLLNSARHVITKHVRNWIYAEYTFYVLYKKQNEFSTFLLQGRRSNNYWGITVYVRLIHMLKAVTLRSNYSADISGSFPQQLIVPILRFVLSTIYLKVTYSLLD